MLFYYNLLFSPLLACYLCESLDYVSYMFCSQLVAQCLNAVELKDILSRTALTSGKKKQA